VINIDPVSGGFDHVVANINTGTRNRDLAMDPNGGILVVTGDNGLNIIELIQSGLGFDYAVTNVNPGTTTRNVSVTHDGGTAVVTTEDGNIFMVGIVRGTSYFGNAYYNYNPKAKAGDGTTSYDGQYYYVTNPDNNQVTVYELLYEEGGGGYDESSFPRRRALKELMTIPTGERPEGIFNDHDDDKFGTANFDGDNITLIAKRTGDEKVVTDLIKDLFVAVDGLKNTEGFKDALANELLIKINDALKNINNKKTKTAINMLKAFINKVKALDKAGEFPPDDPDIAVYLIATAQRIIDLLGGKSETEESTEASFDQSQPDLISVSKLGEIFPNPFSQTVKINYEIAESVGSPEKVFIRIYDISGRLVGTLVNETMPSGRYSTLWSGKYEKGGPAPLGSYFIRFSAGKTNEVKQIMLIR
jgi:flagellar hook assembly protein FlgD